MGDWRAATWPQTADELVAVQHALAGEVFAPYQPGLLALREGAILSAAVAALGSPPDVLLVDATGLDHPRHAGLAVHLGAVCGVPTVGVTHRPLVATGGCGLGRTSAHLTCAGERT